MRGPIGVAIPLTVAEAVRGSREGEIARHHVHVFIRGEFGGVICAATEAGVLVDAKADVERVTRAVLRAGLRGYGRAVAVVGAVDGGERVAQGVRAWRAHFEKAE